MTRREQNSNEQQPWGAGEIFQRARAPSIPFKWRLLAIVRYAAEVDGATGLFAMPV
jgi:hypothetical protein